MDSTILKYNLISIITNAIFFLPVFVLFLQANGLSLTQVFFLETTFSIAIIFLEIPTGFFADVRGRRNAMILGSIFFSIGLLIYSVSGSFLLFVLAELFWGAGFAFLSGSTSAYLYDVLVSRKQITRFQMLEGRAFFWGRAASVFASIIGAKVAEANLRNPFYIMIPQMILLMIIAFSIKEDKIKKIKKDYLKEFTKAFHITMGNVELRGLVFYMSIVGGFGTVIFWLMQPYMRYLGFEIETFGWVYAGFGLVTAISAFYAYKIERFLGRRWSLSILGFLIGIPCILMSFFLSKLSVLFMVFVEFSWSFHLPVLRDYINRLVKSKIRATVLSIASFFTMIVIAIFSPLIGYIADIASVPTAMLSLGIITTISSAGLVVKFKKDRLV